MIYALIGKAVVKGVRMFLRQRYGATYTPKPVLATVVVGLLAAVVAFGAKRVNS